MYSLDCIVKGSKHLLYAIVFCLDNVCIGVVYDMVTVVHTDADGGVCQANIVVVTQAFRIHE